MLKGRSLKYGSTIGIIAPASPEDRSIIDKKVEVFTNLGFKVKLGDHLYDRYGHLAGSDSNRGNDLTNMFLDDSVDGIIAFRGGYGSIRTLPYIDSKIIKKNPKFFCGFSDITLLLNHFSSLGLITFHGPMINSDFNDEVTLKSFLDISSHSKRDYCYNLINFNNISFVHPSSFSGRIVGGNLSIICSSIGTPYEIDTRDSILLIEEVNESPYAIDRMLTQLINSNKFHRCNGIIIGHLTGCELSNYSRSFTLEQVIYDRLKPLKIPLIIGFPFGHSYPNITIPIGSKAYFSHEDMKLTIKDSFLL
ncbi:S66 peptidase family protein [Clostridium paraputrificum]|uniref:S66 peptidase family protein n=1 Tax=Clostridium TaxID=1485 RepID=UPI003D34A226